jgi:hypothetical protein
MTAEITEQDIKRGFKLDYPLSWREIVLDPELVNADAAETLDTLHALIPNESDVKIVNVNGKPSIDHWNNIRKGEEIRVWLAHCYEQGLITHEELGNLWYEVCVAR